MTVQQLAFRLASGCCSDVPPACLPQLAAAEPAACQVQAERNGPKHGSVVLGSPCQDASYMHIILLVLIRGGTGTGSASL